MDIRALANMTTQVVAVVHAKLPLQKEKDRQVGNVCFKVPVGHSNGYFAESR